MPYGNCKHSLEIFSEIRMIPVKPRIAVLLASLITQNKYPHMLLQFHRHHSYFRNDFQMTSAIQEGEK